MAIDFTLPPDVEDVRNRVRDFMHEHVKPREAAALAAASQTAFASDNPKMDAELRHVEHEWARIKYQVADEDAQLAQMKALADEAAKICKRYGGRAEPLVWSGIVVSTEAGMAGTFSALGLADDARDFLEQAGKINPTVLDGAVPTSLGALYYLVPGFPLSFGDDDKARTYLEKGLAMNPDGLDSNFFYGDFLFRQDDYKNAETVLEHALKAPVNHDRPVWDAGRRAEIQTLLQRIKTKSASAS